MGCRKYSAKICTTTNRTGYAKKYREPASLNLWRKACSLRPPSCCEAWIEKTNHPKSISLTDRSTQPTAPSFSWNLEAVSSCTLPKLTRAACRKKDTPAIDLTTPMQLFLDGSKVYPMAIAIRSVVCVT